MTHLVPLEGTETSSIAGVEALEIVVMRLTREAS
jgi:hypothetical protein